MHEWTELDAAPPLPPSLPQLPEDAGTWWRAVVDQEASEPAPGRLGKAGQRVRLHATLGPDMDGGQHGHETYVHVAGDGKARAIYVLTIYTVPLTGERAPSEARPAQYPTIPELWHIMTEFALAGALFAVAGPHGAQALGVAGGEPPTHRGGHVVQMLQCGCEDGSPAAHRFKLSDVISTSPTISIAGAKA